MSREPCGIPNGCDCPVVIGFDLDISMCGRHAKLNNGVVLRRYLTHGRTEVNLEELNIVECHLFIPLYDRFSQLPQVWGDLQQGQRVLCG